jgi:starch synthase (maltosyl-transferring)
LVVLDRYLKEGDIVIEAIRPQIDGGRFRAKAVVGDRAQISADIFKDGPDLLQAAIRYRGPDETKWSTAPMALAENDRWTGAFYPDQVGRWSYAIEAWTDHFGTWRRLFIKKVEVGDDIELELAEGARLIESNLAGMPSGQRKELTKAVAAMRNSADPKAPPGFADPRVAAALSDVVHTAMERYRGRKGGTISKPVLELTVDRERARFGAWYEMFPRSSGKPGTHGTFKTAAARLPAIAAMGFDVLYLPPIHPIGEAFRKGPNNTLHASPDDVGSPWAIGAADGGHTAVHPALGTIEDFDAFVAKARDNGLEIALDYAIQCSPDHPWVTEHPEWFNHRPDGTIRYAENPPKKYQDVYPVNFDTENKKELWTALKDVVDFWIAHGVTIFRVDNPHTKPFPFWEWLIEAVQGEHPDVIFLAEAFTRPTVMRRLAKLGFTQSYTYFTWRNEKWDLTEYLTELTQTEMADYFRPNFFTNTPDILHEYLQRGGPPAFKIRLVLAAFLSPSYGIYSGYELFENVPVKEGSEEYLDSEKFEVKHRDWNAAGNLAPYITRINETRRKHASLSAFRNLHFHEIDKEQIIAFSKRSAHDDAFLVVVNLNPFNWEEGTLRLDLDALGLGPEDTFDVEDVITGARYTWRGPENYVRLDPAVEPAHIFRIES